MSLFPFTKCSTALWCMVMSCYLRRPYYVFGELGNLRYSFGALGALIWGTWDTSIWGLKYVHTTYINIHLAHILVCVSTLYFNQRLSCSLAGIGIATWARSKRAWFLEMSHWRRSLSESIWFFRVQLSQLRWEIFRMTKFEQDYPQCRKLIFFKLQNLSSPIIPKLSEYVLGIKIKNDRTNFVLGL